MHWECSLAVFQKNELQSEQTKCPTFFWQVALCLNLLNIFNIFIIRLVFWLAYLFQYCAFYKDHLFDIYSIILCWKNFSAGWLAMVQYGLILLFPPAGKWICWWGLLCSWTVAQMGNWGRWVRSMCTLEKVALPSTVSSNSRALRSMLGMEAQSAVWETSTWMDIMVLFWLYLFYVVVCCTLRSPHSLATWI